MRRRRPRLATRLMLAQALVVAIGAITLVVAATLVAPGLFRDHLMHAGVTDPEVQVHAEEAFASSFAIAVAVAVVAALTAAGLVSWFLVRRISRPVEDLADSAHEVAAGRYDVEVPAATFSNELNELSESFAFMAGRLADMDATRIRLLADLAHEVRTPLATLEAYIDGMEDHMVPVEAASWATMRDQVARLRRLSGDLRETAAAEEHALGLTMAPIDARAAAAAATAAALPRYQSKDVDLSLSVPESVCGIWGDDVRLQQVLGNLLDNALQHTGGGGKVDVTVLTVGGSVAIRVTDTGEGIPPEQLESVFERLHRVDRSRHASDGSGSGLGLTIARAIVTDHGGKLTASSQGIGHGSTFSITLPSYDL